MADMEKVIKGLKCCCGTGMCFHGCPYYDASKKITECTSRLALEALDLLKEQEPVLAIQRRIMHMLVWCCGSCGAPIEDGDEFCSMCGRKVKWNE